MLRKQNISKNNLTARKLGFDKIKGGLTYVSHFFLLYLSQYFFFFFLSTFQQETHRNLQTSGYSKDYCICVFACVGLCVSTRVGTLKPTPVMCILPSQREIIERSNLTFHASYSQAGTTCFLAQNHILHSSPSLFQCSTGSDHIEVHAS